MPKHHIILFFFFGLISGCALAQAPRIDISLNNNWKTIADDNNKYAYEGFESNAAVSAKWKVVDVPRNWDQYEGYRRLRHGNRHGYAWYKKTFTVQQLIAGKRYFLFFEGVGSYATIWLNGKPAGYHAGGRTTFTIDVTPYIYTGTRLNVLAVRADHPANIRDLPWVCGGCSDERGFSEGSQPMGIFRPVHLIITDPVRIVPFGVHIWNDTTVSAVQASLYVETEVKNYGSLKKDINISNKLMDECGRLIVRSNTVSNILPGKTLTAKPLPIGIGQPHLWSPGDPYLYTLITEIVENGKVIDRMDTKYGIRTISWPIGKSSSSNQFLINGKPFFINGIAEYEHLIGNSHAFSPQQIRTRVMQVKAAGFNAFRDAHQPHNLRYQQYWDSLGILWWPQLSAHIWFDEPQFRANFKALLSDWVKERRNSPSLILWGLQNESKLPEDFAKECSQMIRQLDPTASAQRLITTCNGGAGTDWDVPQNWTGTYGGNPATYDQDIKKEILVGEYGAWRTLDLHTEGGFAQNGPLSEDRMSQMMEMKIKLAEKVKDSAAGHFMWLLTSHENPGRVQSGEGYRELDRVGPVNYKGLFTPWEEPTDAFYMYRANYVSKEKEPMVYIVSHNWPDRWIKPGLKDGIVVYSNCDEVELFNDVASISLGKKSNHGLGTHFQWDGVNVRYGTLYAVGYVNGKAVAKDLISLNHLPPPPNLPAKAKTQGILLNPAPGYHYIYRVNCGGPQYKDEHQNIWMADRSITSGSWGSSSWTNDFTGMPSFYASQRTVSDPIEGTDDNKLFQSFRYGRDKLRYTFPLPDGEYLVELYFLEPWLGRAGINASGWRLFDVAINDRTVLKDIDIWKEVGTNKVLKKTVVANIRGGTLVISFPMVSSGEAVISAIAIASRKRDIEAAPSPPSIIQKLDVEGYSGKWTIEEWANTGDEQFYSTPVTFSALPPELYGAEWIKGGLSNEEKSVSFMLSENADIYIATEQKLTDRDFLDFTDTKEVVVNGNGTIFKLLKRRYSKGSTISFKTSSNITLFALPVTSIEPPYDLKPIVSYKAINALVSSTEIQKKKVDGKDRVLFNSSNPGSVEWAIAIGAADIYSFTISYNNPNAATVKGKLSLINFEGTVMKEEVVDITPTKTGKLNYISTTTGSMVNAGNYKVKLSLQGAEGVSIQSLDIQ